MTKPKKLATTLCRCPICGAERRGVVGRDACGGSKAHPHRPELFLAKRPVGQTELEAA